MERQPVRKAKAQKLARQFFDAIRHLTWSLMSWWYFFNFKIIATHRTLFHLVRQVCHTCRVCYHVPIDQPRSTMQFFRTRHPMALRAATVWARGPGRKAGDTEHRPQMRMATAQTYHRGDRLNRTQDNPEVHNIVNHRSMVDRTEDTLGFPLHPRALQFRPRHQTRDQTEQTYSSFIFQTTSPI